MNQSILLNNDLAFVDDKGLWKMTGFYQGQYIEIYIAEGKLAKQQTITTQVLLDLEADIEDWLEANEPDEHGVIWL